MDQSLAPYDGGQGNGDATGLSAASEGTTDARQGGAASQPLTASAPVSSLLPQLSAANGLFQGPQQPNLLNQALQQARYAMLLQAAGTLEQPGNTSNPLAGLASLSQHLGQHNFSTGGQSVVTSISSSSAPTMNTAAAAQLLATHSAVSALTATHQQQQQQQYRGQSLANLENQVALLQKLNQPVPQTLALLLADARRREEKKHAKRIANRKSASTSRARKKALVQEMTDLNAKLRRQALILSLLPDLVIVTDANGIVNFCSEQVERILRYSASTIVGSAISDLLVPSSRDRMKKLIGALVETEASGSSAMEGTLSAKLSKKEKRKQVSEDASELDKKSKLSGVPLSVVQVDSGCRVTKTSNDETDNSDASRDSNKQASSLTGSTATPQPSDSDDNKKPKEAKTKSSDKESGASDDNSHASSLSIEGEDAARNLQSANANLERNVRWHNKNMKAGGRSKAEYKDDVIGAAVTANNASARLSSLRVHESEDLALNKEDKNPLSSEEDSGYRESNDSREETSSSTLSDTSSKGGAGRRKPMAPTCNVCLIRDDLSTIWCEVTSSIRTRCIKQEEPFDPTMDDPKSKASASSNASDSESVQETVKEIYLCLRPIRAGRHKVHEQYRFPRANGIKAVSEDSKTVPSSGEGGSGSSSLELGDSLDMDVNVASLKESSSIPPKKRKGGEENFESEHKKAKTTDAGHC